MENDYLTVNEFLSLMAGKMTRTTLYRLIDNGTIPHVRIGLKILIRRTVLDEMYEAHNKPREVLTDSAGG